MHHSHSTFTVKQLYILDAVNSLFRSYFAIKHMSNPQGESTNALYGFIRSVQKIIKDFEPEHLIAVFDGPDNKRARINLYKEYKGHRARMPEDLFNQLEKAIEFCALAGIPHLEVEGVEADDTMGSIAVWAAGQGVQVFLCSSDKDLCQLVGDKIFLLNSAKDNLLVDAAKVKELYGVAPKQFVDFLAIMGDTSDGIPGIPGLGPKSAMALLAKSHTLERLLERPELAGEGRKKALIETYADQARLSKKLAALDLHVPFPKQAAFFALKKPDVPALTAFYQDCHFLSLLKELEMPKEMARGKKEKRHYHLVDDEKSFKIFLERFKQKPLICLDTETDRLSPMQAEIVGIGFACEEGEAYYVPFNGALSKKQIIEGLQPLLENPKTAFVGHNIKYDMHALENSAIRLSTVAFDTLIASYLLRPGSNRHGLDTLVLERFNVKMTPIESLIGKGKKQRSMREVPVAAVAEYCCADADYTFRLKNLFQEELKDAHLTELFNTLEIPLIPVLQKMERRGIYVDPDAFKVMAKELTHALDRVVKHIYKAAGGPFNLNSPKQLSQVLFERLGFKPVRAKKTQTHLSTGADVLAKLAIDHPVCKAILEYRTLEKLRSTYVDTLPEQINPDDHRIHCSFNQSVTATGRLSCQDPNLQNIPVRSEEGRQIRKAFRPEKQGWRFLSADYSQIELRLLAAFSGEKNLIHAFRNKEDIHAFTAAIIFGVPLDQVTLEMRHRAKAVNFGIIYGQRAPGLAATLSIPVKEAAAFIKTYFAAHPSVEKYIEECIAFVEKHGYAETLFGRRRPIPEIHSPNPSLRFLAHRLAVNTPLQGSQADIIKKAMIEIDRKLTSTRAAMILQIHDELLIELPEKEVPDIEKLVKHEMETVVSLTVPLTVDIKIGKNWEEC